MLTNFTTAASVIFWETFLNTLGVLGVIPCNLALSRAPTLQLQRSYWAISFLTPQIIHLPLWTVGRLISASQAGNSRCHNATMWIAIGQRLKKQM